MYSFHAVLDGICTDSMLNALYTGNMSVCSCKCSVVFAFFLLCTFEKNHYPLSTHLLISLSSPVTTHHTLTHTHMSERFSTSPTLYVLSTEFLYSGLTTHILNHIKYAFHWFLFDNVSGFTKYHSKLMIRILCKIPYAAIKNGNEERKQLNRNMRVALFLPYPHVMAVRK